MIMLLQVIHSDLGDFKSHETRGGKILHNLC